MARKVWDIEIVDDKYMISIGDVHSPDYQELNLTEEEMKELQMIIQEMTLTKC